MTTPSRHAASRRALAALLFVTPLASLPLATHAYTLTNLTSFSTAGVVGATGDDDPGAEGLAYGLEDTDMDGEADDRVLYLSEGDDCGGTSEPDCRIFVYAANASGSAAPLRSFTVSALEDIRGLDRLPNGDLVAAGVSSGADDLLQISSLNGAAILTGVNATFPIASAELETVVFRSATSVLVGDEATGLLHDFNPVTLGFNGDPFDTDLDDFSGMALAEEGLLFVVDDSSGGGISLLRILDPAGGVLNGLTFNVGVLTKGIAGCEDVAIPNPSLPLTCVDPEGLAYDQVNRVLFMAFENEQRVLSFQVGGVIPEPSSVVLLAAALAGVSAIRRSRSAD